MYPIHAPIFLTHACAASCADKSKLRALCVVFVNHLVAVMAGCRGRKRDKTGITSCSVRIKLSLGNNRVMERALRFLLSLASTRTNTNSVQCSFT